MTDDVAIAVLLVIALKAAVFILIGLAITTTIEGGKGGDHDR